jgi:hypothetical protein
MLKYGLDAWGSFYFVVLFSAMQQCWQNKLDFDLRIDAAPDLAHKLVDAAVTLLVAVAALHVATDNAFAYLTPLEVLSAEGFSSPRTTL